MTALSTQKSKLAAQERHEQELNEALGRISGNNAYMLDMLNNKVEIEERLKEVEMENLALKQKLMENEKKQTEMKKMLANKIEECDRLNSVVK